MTVEVLSWDLAFDACLWAVTLLKAMMLSGNTRFIFIPLSMSFHSPNSDMIVITAGGKRLYWAAPAGPLYRVEIRYLLDRARSNAEVAAYPKVMQGCVWEAR